MKEISPKARKIVLNIFYCILLALAFQAGRVYQYHKLIQQKLEHLEAEMRADSDLTNSVTPTNHIPN